MAEIVARKMAEYLAMSSPDGCDPATNWSWQKKFGMTMSCAMYPALATCSKRSKVQRPNIDLMTCGRGAKRFETFARDSGAQLRCLGVSRVSRVLLYRLNRARPMATEPTAAESVALLDEKLRKEMVEAQASVARWTTEQKRIIDSLALHAQTTLEEDKENLALRREQLHALTNAEQMLQQQRREENSKIEEIRKEIELLKSQEDILPNDHARLVKSLDQQRQLELQQELAFQEATRSKEQKLDELEKGCVAYRSMLGLEFERVGDERLKLVMTNIDARAPSAVFSFTVFVDASDNYHIEQCEPNIETLPELIAELNQTNDFSAFVRSARREFKSMCA